MKSGTFTRLYFHLKGLYVCASCICTLLPKWTFLRTFKKKIVLSSLRPVHKQLTHESTGSTGFACYDIADGKHSQFIYVQYVYKHPNAGCTVRIQLGRILTYTHIDRLLSHRTQTWVRCGAHRTVRVTRELTGFSQAAMHSCWRKHRTFLKLWDKYLNWI